MANDVKFTLNLNTEGAKAKIREAILAGVTEVFELDIKPEAVNLSPYLTGNNRRLIDVDVVEVPEGIQATLYSQSGYGGYLELGTVKMKAQPYLWPAFNQFVSKIFDVVKSKLRDTL